MCICTVCVEIPKFNAISLVVRDLVINRTICCCLGESPSIFDIARHSRSVKISLSTFAFVRCFSQRSLHDYECHSQNDLTINSKGLCWDYLSRVEVAGNRTQMLLHRLQPSVTEHVDRIVALAQNAGDLRDGSILQESHSDHGTLLLAQACKR